MKVRPKFQNRPFNDDELEAYGMRISWLPSKRGNKSLKYLQRLQYEHEDDFYDDYFMPARQKAQKSIIVILD